MRWYIIIWLGLTVSVSSAQYDLHRFENVVELFKTEYRQLNIPELELSYVSNLRNIQSLEKLDVQYDFFKRYESELFEIDIDNLSPEFKISYAILQYEIDLNLDRIDLEKKWFLANPSINGGGLYNEDLGKDWYRLLLREWVDNELTPEEAFEMGLREVELVKQRLNNIVKDSSSPNRSPFYDMESDSSYFVDDKEIVRLKYEALRSRIRERTKNYFPEMENIPLVDIAIGRNENLAIAPAYYFDNTFYYNFFGHSYDLKDMEWIFLHEAIPGHHYQANLHQDSKMPFASVFNYMGYVEGWGAYVEQYGKNLGVYQSPQDEYGQLRWDLIRSIRVVLDVGINYYGWSDKKALEFWNLHLKGRDDIANRELNRMKRWPAQVITYKHGKSVLDRLKGGLKTAPELMAFHKKVLKYGPIPLSIMENLWDNL